MSEGLSKLRVLELAEGWSAAALCGKLLADFGAEVIKIELPAGDLLRGRKPFGPHGQSYDFHLIAANKKSVCLDPQLRSDKESLERLIANVDVIVEDRAFTRDIAPDIDFERLRRDNPGLTHCILSPFGRSGPLSDYTGNELIVQAMSGMMATTGFADDPPTRAGLLCGQYAAGILAAVSILGAVWRRDEGGAGQEIDISVHDCLLGYLGTLLPTFLTTGKNAKRIGNLHSMAVPWNSYRAKDGWVFICTATEPQWQALLQAMGRSDLVGDERYRSKDDRLARLAEVDAIVGQWTAAKSVAEIVDLLEEANVPAEPVNTLEGVLEDAQVRTRDMLVELDQPRGGKLYATGPIAKMGATSGWACRPAPSLGEHNEQVLFSAAAQGGIAPKSGRGSKTTGALQGVRVLELGCYTAGPVATRLLASLGAEVIKVEPPAKGDGLREIGGPKVDGSGYTFHMNNYGKKGVTLDTNQKEGRDIFLELVRTSDLLVENFVPGTLGRWGLDYETLKGINPALIYCSLSGFGWNGAMRTKRAFDTVIQARAGFLSQTGRADGPPTKVGPSMADVTGGFAGALAALAGLFQRKASGEGQFIDVAMYDVLVWMTAEFWPLYFNGDKIPRRMGNAHCRHVPNNAYAAKDRLVVVAVETDSQWNRLLELMGCDDAKDVERFARSEDRLAHRGEVDALVAEWIKDLDAVEVVDQCQSAGVPAALVLELSEIAGHAHVLARRMIVEVPLHSGSSERIRLLGCPLKLSATPADVRQTAPRLGEHNRDVYCGILGHSAAQLDDWKARGII